MSFVITLQDHDEGEEYNIQVSEEDYKKITSGDYQLANKYLQKEVERKNRLLAFRFLQKESGEVCNEKGKSNNVLQLNESMNTSSNWIETDNEKNLGTNHCTDVFELEINKNDTNLSQRWSDRETKQLIELYRVNFEKLHDRKYKAKLIYIEMANHFDRFNSDQVESKIKYLKKTYKVILDNTNKTGRGKITWQFFNSMQEILGNKPENNPISIASNRAGFEQNASTEDSMLNSDSDSETPLPKMRKHNNNIEVGAEAGPSWLNNSVKKRKPSTKTQTEPEWVKEFRTELAQHHRERMDKQQQFLDLFKEWISKSKN